MKLPVLFISCLGLLTLGRASAAESPQPRTAAEAGIGRMIYPRFMAYAFGGAVLWIGSLVYAGYFFGNIPWVKNNLSLVIIGIIVLSILPGMIEFVRHKLAQQRAASK